MRFEILEEGFVARLWPVARGTDLAVGPRVVFLPTEGAGGEVVCTFMLTARIATNDFVPVLCRSRDLGQTWTVPTPIWPSLPEKWSLFVGISRDPYSGKPFLYGTRTVIDIPGESNWSDATQGLKVNELIWSISEDNGCSWNDPVVIPMPIPGSAEAPGPLCVLRSGRWVGCYSPYNTFDPAVTVDRSQVVSLHSDNCGRTWRHNSMLRFASPHTGAAEAWVVELSDGTLLGTGWQVPDHGDDLPNAYALSHDGGTTWTSTASTGVLGQSTALAPWNDGRAMFLYNQRKHDDPGVRLAVVRPTESSFGIEHDDLIWRAETRTQSATQGNLSEWSDFSFGEPSIVHLPDETWLVTLWCIQPSGSGIRYVRVRIT